MIYQVVKTVVSWLPSSAPEALYRHLLSKWPFRPITELVLSRLIPDHVEVTGVVVALNARDPIVSGSLAFGAYEQYESSLFLEKVHPGDVVFDVGANVGYFTALGSKACGPTGRVFAFEPDPENYSFLTKTIELNHATNVTAIRCGVSNVEGEGSLFLCHANRGDHRIYDTKERRDRVSIPLTTIDNVIEREKLPHVDVVKMDIQGAELLACKGMQNLLDARRPLRIFIEYWPYGLLKTGGSGDDLLRVLYNAGFRIFRIDSAAECLIPVNQTASLDPVTRGTRYVNLYCER